MRFRKVINALTLVASVLFRLFVFGLMIVSAWLFWRGISEGNGNEIAAVAGVIPVTIAAVLWSVYQHWRQSREAVSQFYLERYIGTIGKAYETLANNNDKIKWVSGSRMLGACEMMDDRITEPHHRQILEVTKDQYRSRFGEIIQNDSIKPAFFYGTGNEMRDIDEAAKMSTTGQMVIRDMNEYAPLPYTTELPEEAVRMVWRFANYPKDYDDMLSQKFTKQEENEVGRLFPAVHFWLQHRKRVTSQFGEIYKKAPIEYRVR